MANRVVIVEHEPVMIAIAGPVVDRGPLAGLKGGDLVNQDNHTGLLTSGTLTGDHTTTHQPVKARGAQGDRPVAYRADPAEHPCKT